MPKQSQIRFLHPHLSSWALLTAAVVSSSCGSDLASAPPSDGSGGAAQSTAASTSSNGSGGSSTTGSTTAASSGGGGSGNNGGTPQDCSDLPLCYDFENDTAGQDPDPTVWAVVSPNCSGGGTLSVDDSQARSGAKSLKVEGQGGYCDHIFISNSTAFTQLNDIVYGRFFVRFTDAFGEGHTTFMTMKDDDDGGKDLRMGGQKKILMWNRESDDATLPALSPAGVAKSIEPANQAWLCVEFMIEQSSGTLSTWVDGSEIEALQIDGTPTPDVDQQWLNQANWSPKLSDFKLGWESYAGQAMTLWFDDIALGNGRIGCD